MIANNSTFFKISKLSGVIFVSYLFNKRCQSSAAITDNYHTSVEICIFGSVPTGILWFHLLTKRGDFINAQAVKCDLVSSCVKSPLPLNQRIRSIETVLCRGLTLATGGIIIKSARIYMYTHNIQIIPAVEISRLRDERVAILFVRLGLLA